MKIINTSDKPYHWTHDSKNYGPLNPGEIQDHPPEIAKAAIRRSVFYDEMDEVAGYTVSELSGVAREQLAKLIKYTCPMVHSGQCNAAPFENLEQLRAHIATHIPAAPKPAAGPATK